MIAAHRFSSSIRFAALVVCAAATIPYLSTVNNYFVRDDFGVVQLLASKPATYFPRWFYTTWMDYIWGYTPDEIRPFPALSYQLTSLGPPASTMLHHVLNIALHAANGVLVLMIGHRLAGLSVARAAFAGLVFVLLPVHAESVAWITGRVDSMPALFYMASFLAYARWRESSVGWRYAVSIALFFVALFTKQTVITMIGTLVAWDVLADRRFRLSIAWIWPYVPFVLLTGGYLALRYVLFGQVAREGQLSTTTVGDVARLVQRHLTHVVTGYVELPAMVTLLIVLVLAVAAGLLVRLQRDGDWRGTCARLVFFGPVWWLIGVAPTIVAGYESPRHVYLASAGWAITIGIVMQLAWNASRGLRLRRLVGLAASLVLGLYLTGLHAAVRTWNVTAAVSRQATRDTEHEVQSAPPGTLLVLGAPPRSWEWVLPFAVQPPFVRSDLTTRVFIVSPMLLHCCRGQWFEDTRRTIRSWQAQRADAPIVMLRWDKETGAVSRLTDAEFPGLHSLFSVLLEVRDHDALDSALVRMITDLPLRPALR